MGEKKQEREAEVGSKKEGKEESLERGSVGAGGRSREDRGVPGMAPPEGLWEPQYFTSFEMLNALPPRLL